MRTPSIREDISACLETLKYYSKLATYELAPNGDEIGDSVQDRAITHRRIQPRHHRPFAHPYHFDFLAEGDQTSEEIQN